MWSREKLNAAADPRAKLLRKRRWALRLAVFFAVSSVFWVGVTALLASWSTPVWALFIPAPIAVGAAFLATLAFLRYRWLRREPLPPQRTRAARRLPPWGSAARQPMAALADAERGLVSLLGVMERGRLLPADELRDLRATAEQTAATMAATATEIVSMERTVGSAPQAARAPGAHHRRVQRATRPGCPAIQRHGLRGRATGVGRQLRVHVEFADDAAPLPRAADLGDRPADRLGAGLRRAGPAAGLNRSGQKVGRRDGNTVAATARSGAFTRQSSRSK